MVVEALAKENRMTVKPNVGDSIRVVNGKYKGKIGRVSRVTMWKVEVKLCEGGTVMIMQSSVEKYVNVAKIDGARGVASSEQELLKRQIEAEIVRVRLNVDRLEKLVREMCL